MVSGEGTGLLYLTLHCHYRIIGFVVTSSQPQRLYQGDVGHTASGVAFQVDSSRLPGYATEGTLWASLSGVILQTLPELVTLLKAHSGHRFPVSSSRLCLNWLRYWRHSLSIAFRYHPPDCLNWLRCWRHTLSIAFRHHPPDSASKVKLVTPLKEHSLTRAAVYWPAAPSESLGTCKTVEATDRVETCTHKRIHSDVSVWR